MRMTGVAHAAQQGVDTLHNHQDLSFGDDVKERGRSIDIIRRIMVDPAILKSFLHGLIKILPGFLIWLWRCV